MEDRVTERLERHKDREKGLPCADFTSGSGTAKQGVPIQNAGIAGSGSTHDAMLPAPILTFFFF